MVPRTTYRLVCLVLVGVRVARCRRKTTTQRGRVDFFGGETGVRMLASLKSHRKVARVPKDAEKFGSVRKQLFHLFSESTGSCVLTFFTRHSCQLYLLYSVPPVVSHIQSTNRGKRPNQYRLGYTLSDTAR